MQFREQFVLVPTRGFSFLSASIVVFGVWGGPVSGDVTVATRAGTLRCAMVWLWLLLSLPVSEFCAFADFRTTSCTGIR